MAKFSLIPYNKDSAPAVNIQTELNVTEESLFIGYKVTGELGAVDFGQGEPHHARVIKLWEKTCFELFMKDAKDSYIEFNFSPEFEWNCFYFKAKGDTLAEYKKMDLVKFDILHADDVVHVIVEIDKNKFPDDFFSGELTVGITSVIKEKSGALSYWALSHHDTRPNFHDFRSYVPMTK